MGTRKTKDALQGHVDVKDAYRKAQDDVRALLRLIAEETTMHGRYAKKAGLTFAHVGDLATVRSSLVDVMTQLAQQDREFVWKRVAEVRKAGK